MDKEEIDDINSRKIELVILKTSNKEHSKPN